MAVSLIKTPVTLGQWSEMNALFTQAAKDAALDNEKRAGRQVITLRQSVETLRNLPEASNIYLDGRNPYLADIAYHLNRAAGDIQEECAPAAELHILAARQRWDSYGMSMGPLS